MAESENPKHNLPDKFAVLLGIERRLMTAAVQRRAGSAILPHNLGSADQRGWRAPAIGSTTSDSASNIGIMDKSNL